MRGRFTKAVAITALAVMVSMGSVTLGTAGIGGYGSKYTTSGLGSGNYMIQGLGSGNYHQQSSTARAIHPRSHLTGLGSGNFVLPSVYIPTGLGSGNYHPQVSSMDQSFGHDPHGFIAFLLSLLGIR